jgi:SAM-dependent methyltransferase
VTSLSTFECRVCGSTRRDLVLDLGNQPLANNLLREEDLAKPEPRFDLVLAVCIACWQMQIVSLVPPVDLFTEYLYFSSFSDSMLRHARTAAERYIADFRLNKDSFVVEIASNDGYLLRNFVERSIPCLGIEPAANIAKVAIERGIDTRVEFFGSDLAKALVAEGRRPDLVLGNNVFAHVPQINDFVAGLRILLRPGGRAIFEFPYAGDFIDKCEFDTVYHEHVFYFFLLPLVALFKRHDMELFHVERLPIHGGSLRIFAAARGEEPVQESVRALLREEETRGVETRAFYRTFSECAHKIRADLLRLLAELKAENKTVAAYGASAKGTTLLNFVQPDPTQITFIADRSTYKHGRYSPGLHIPICPPEQLLVAQPDYTLLLTWNFAEEILAQQSDYRSRGGRFIIPIPEVRVV